MQRERMYFCIDMKSFFASVECAERGLNPFQTNLVVANPERGRGAICLAVTPKMKSLGVKNRCRLFEIPKGIDYIVAMPRMRKYIEYAADIHSIYLKYIDKDDIHPYSIDESFIDATDYLKIYKKTPLELAKMLLAEIADKKGIPAAAGIGTNLYLAKVALDITSKKSKDNIGYLNEGLYKKMLWRHVPITDFWQVAHGTARRLYKRGIFDMYGVAHYPPELLYREFGIDAELLIDHAWGRESCTIGDIKNYKGKSRSVSTSQILFEDYPFEKARIVMEEMVRSLSYELMRYELVTDSVNIYVGYSKDVIPPSKGHVRMPIATNLSALILPYAMGCLDKVAQRGQAIRRLGIAFSNVASQRCERYDLFTDPTWLERERRRELAAIQIHQKYGKNALIRAADLLEGATARIRNTLIGGHNSE